MDVVVQHRITDPEKFFSIDAEQVAGGGPPGVRGRQFFPSRDHSVAVCLWEADSIDDGDERYPHVYGPIDRVRCRG